MTPYVQREIFRAFDQKLFRQARTFVEKVGSHWGNELRCHELARAVHKMFADRAIHCIRVVDGKLGMVDHSWIEIVMPIAHVDRERMDRGTERTAIIDVYCPGRLPQVQLIDTFPSLQPLYIEGERRTDIGERIVDQLVSEMRDGLTSHVG